MKNTCLYINKTANVFVMGDSREFDVLMVFCFLKNLYFKKTIGYLKNAGKEWNGIQNTGASGQVTLWLCQFHSSPEASSPQPQGTSRRATAEGVTAGHWTPNSPAPTPPALCAEFHRDTAPCKSLPGAAQAGRSPESPHSPGGASFPWHTGLVPRQRRAPQPMGGRGRPLLPAPQPMRVGGRPGDPAPLLAWRPKTGLGGGLIGHTAAPAANQNTKSAHRALGLVALQNWFEQEPIGGGKRGGGPRFESGRELPAALWRAGGGWWRPSSWSGIKRCGRGCGAARPASRPPWTAYWTMWAMGAGWPRVPGAVLRREGTRGLESSGAVCAEPRTPVPWQERAGRSQRREYSHTTGTWDCRGWMRDLVTSPSWLDSVLNADELAFDGGVSIKLQQVGDSVRESFSL